MSDNFKLIAGDSLREVPRIDEPIDIVITDPPYPVGGKSSMTTDSSIIECDRMVNDLTQSLLMGVIRQVPWRDPENCVVFLMCDWRKVSMLYMGLMYEGFKVPNCIVWDKVASGMQMAGFGARHEMVLYGRRGKLERRPPPDGTYGVDIISISRPTSKKKTHAFAKPPELAQKLTKMFQPCTVLDPFCGSGGLLLGASLAGHRVVGIDTKEEYIERTRQALRNPKSHSLGRPDKPASDTLLDKLVDDDDEYGEVFTKKYLG